MPSPNPPSELPAVQAEVVETKKPEALPCPEMWAVAVYEWRHRRWILDGADNPRMVGTLTERARHENLPYRLIRIPGEGESPSAPTKFPMCAVHSFVTTDVCGCARLDVPSAPTHAGEMPEAVKELVKRSISAAVVMESHDMGGTAAGNLRESISAVTAHYAHPKPTGMTREVEELVVHHRSRKAFMSLSELAQWLDGQDRLVEAIAVRAAGGGA